MKQVVCDRCGKSDALDSSNMRTMTLEQRSHVSVFDLCNDCFNEAMRFVKDKPPVKA